MRTIGKVLVLAMALSGIAAFSAKQTALRPSFEVASVKPAPPDVRAYRVELLPNGMTGAAPLKVLIAGAYEVALDRIKGDSSILDEYFEIDARVRTDALVPGAPVGARNQELKLMLQSLLADRFHLALHKERKDLPVSALVVAKTGPKLKPAKPDAESAAVPPSSRRPRPGLYLEDVDMPEFARDLTSEVGRPVLDRTGIQGHFDIELPPFLGPDLQVGTSSSTPSIFNVLEDQLGLRLESTRAPIEVYVVDHIQRPTEN